MDPRSVVVTGAGRGTGRAIAVAPAHAGSDVIGAVRTQDSAVALRAEVGRTGAAVRTVLPGVADAMSCGRGFAPGCGPRRRGSPVRWRGCAAAGTGGHGSLVPCLVPFPV